MAIFEGSMVALVTPFKDGQIDEVALRKLVDWHVDQGTDVLVPCGTTGESATLSHDEHDRVIEIVVKQAAGRVKVLAGAGSNSTEEAIRLHQFCSEVGADGALHITPYYNKPTQEGLFQHFKAIASSSDVPIILYNVPSRTGVNMKAETTLRLAELPTIVGIKEASGDLVQASRIIQAASDDFALLSGEDALSFPLYALGAKGVISVTANVLPARCKELFLAVKEGNFEKARGLHYELLDLSEVLFIETNPIPVKAALSLMGLIGEELRLPMIPMTKSGREELKTVLKKFDILF